MLISALVLNYNLADSELFRQLISVIVYRILFSFISNRSIAA